MLRTPEDLVVHQAAQIETLRRDKTALLTQIADLKATLEAKNRLRGEEIRDAVNYSVKEMLLRVRTNSHVSN